MAFDFKGKRVVVAEAAEASGGDRAGFAAHVRRLHLRSRRGPLETARSDIARHGGRRMRRV